MNLFAKMKYASLSPYEAFLKAVSGEHEFDLDAAEYYLSKMSDEDIKRPLSEETVERLGFHSIYQGYSPLMICASLVHSGLAIDNKRGLKIVLSLLERGADLYYINQNPNTRCSFFDELRMPMPQMWTELKPYLDVAKPVSRSGSNMLQFAKGETYFADLLNVLTPEQLQEGLTRCCDYGYSALTFGPYSTWQLEELLRVAVPAKIDLNTVDKNGDTLALNLIQGTTVYSKIKMLPQNGVDLNAPVYNGETLLMKAIRTYDELGFHNYPVKAKVTPGMVLDTVLEVTDVNTRTETEFPSALCLAANIGNGSVIRTLFDANAQILPLDEEIVISGLLQNKELSPAEQVEMLVRAQEQIPADLFKDVLDKELRTLYGINENASPIRAALKQNDTNMAIFLADNGFAPIDAEGRASDLVSGNPLLIDLFKTYETVFELTNGQNVMPVSYEKDVRALNRERYNAVELMGLLGAMFKSMESENRPEERRLLTSQGVLATLRLEYAMRNERVNQQ